MISSNKLLNFFMTVIILAAWFMYSECTGDDDENGSNGSNGTTTNTKPVANFGFSPEDPFVSYSVSLNGSGSSGEGLTFQWSILEAPPGSDSEIIDPTSPIASIIPDLPGNYNIKLCVTNEHDLDSCLQKDFEATDLIVDAIVGDDLYKDIGEIVPLNATASTPAGSLFFSWRLLDKPSLSILTSESIVPPNGLSAGFFMDEPGVYEVELHAQYGSYEDIYDTDTLLVTTNPPKIESFNPMSGPEGMTVTITGKNFSSDLLGNTLEFNGVPATIYIATDSKLIVTVPEGASTGPLKVIVAETQEEAESIYHFDVTSSGWIPVLSGIGSLYDVTFYDDNKGIAVGSGGGIYITSDGGYTWDQASSNTSQSLWAVSFGNSTTCYAVGGYETILKSTDGGYSWDVIYSGGQDYTYSGVYFLNESVGYIAGQDLLYTDDGGQTWEDRSPPYGNYYDVFFIDTIGFLAGGSFFHTENGGLSWNSAQSGYYNTSYHGVHFVTPNKGWIVGGPVPVLLESHIAHTTDGGITYTPQAHGIPDELYDVHFVNDVGLVVGKNGTILFTDNGGENWIQEDSGVDHYLRGIHLFDSGQAIIVGYYGGSGLVLRRINK